jgi:hypothetical protein
VFFPRYNCGSWGCTILTEISMQRHLQLASQLCPTICFACCEAAVARGVAKSKGASVRRKYFLQHDQELCDKAVELYLSGLTIYQVASEVGYSHSSINRVLVGRKIERRHGIKPLGSLHVSKGRTYIKTKKGWKLRYRVLAEGNFGKSAIKGKHIHHDNDDCLDDSIGNLIPVTPSTHRAITNRKPKMRKAAALSWKNRRKSK